MAMSISWFQPDWACISLAEDKGLAKHQKGGNPVFGDVKDAKDSQQNIKKEHFIYDYYYIWTPENGGDCV